MKLFVTLVLASRTERIKNSDGQFLVHFVGTCDAHMYPIKMCTLQVFFSEIEHHILHLKQAFINHKTCQFITFRKIYPTVIKDISSALELPINFKLASIKLIIRFPEVVLTKYLCTIFPAPQKDVWSK